MFTMRSVSMALVLSFLGGLASQAADSPISVFPKETGVIVRLKSPQKTLKTVGELATKVDPQQGAKVQQQAAPILGVMISNPSLKGVDQEGDWWLAVFPVENGDPGVVFCIPATDADAMKEAVTGNYGFQTFEKWVIYTEHAGTADKIKQQISQKGASISTLLDKTSTAIWEEGDLSVFINVPHLMKVYQAAFDQGVKQVEDLLDQFPAMVPPQQQGGVDMKAVAEMYAGLFKTLVQSVKDAQGCVAGLSGSAEGVSLSEYAHFSEGSTTAKKLAKNQPAELEQLGQLPANRLAYGAAELDVGAIARWSMQYSLQMYSQDDTEKEKQAKELMEEFQKLKFGGMAMAFGMGDPKQGAMRMFALLETENPKAVRELSQKSAKLMSTYNFGGMKMKTTYKPDAETYGDLKADVARVKYEFDQQADPLQTQIQTQINQILYGPEGMVSRTFYLKDRIAQAVGGGKETAQTLLDALEGKNNVGNQPAFQAMQKQLLPKANLVGMVDLPGTIAAGLDVAVQTGNPVPIAEKDIKAIRGEPSFLGFSVAVEGQGLKAKTVVPVQQMQGIARLVRLIEQAEQQQQGE